MMIGWDGDPPRPAIDRNNGRPIVNPPRPPMLREIPLSEEEQRRHLEGETPLSNSYLRRYALGSLDIVVTRPHGRWVVEVRKPDRLPDLDASPVIPIDPETGPNARLKLVRIHQTFDPWFSPRSMPPSGAGLSR